jgi:hypothetical protein
VPLYAFRHLQKINGNSSKGDAIVSFSLSTALIERVLQNFLWNLLWEGTDADQNPQRPKGMPLKLREVIEHPKLQSQLDPSLVNIFFGKLFLEIFRYFSFEFSLGFLLELM